MRRALHLGSAIKLISLRQLDITLANAERHNFLSRLVAERSVICCDVNFNHFLAASQDYLLFVKFC